MEISIRVAMMEAVPSLKELMPLSARESSKDYQSPQQTESMIKYVSRVDLQLIKDKAYYVAETEGESAGCGGLTKMDWDTALPAARMKKQLP